MSAFLALSPVWTWTILVVVACAVIAYAALVAGGMADDAAEEAYDAAVAETGLEDELDRIRVSAPNGTTGPAWSEPGAEPVEPALDPKIPDLLETLEERIVVARRIVGELSRRLEVHHREIGVDPSRNGCHLCRPGGSLDLWDAR